MCDTFKQKHKEKRWVTGWPKSHYWHARAWYYAVFFSPQKLDLMKQFY